MSDGANFTMLPLWEDMDFSKNCTLWGNFMASFLIPNPWDPSQSVGGSYMLSIQLFEASVPDSYQLPNTTEGFKELFETITEWFTSNLYDHYVWDEYHPEASYWDSTEEFNTRVVWDPIKKCPAEYCKALGYTGNADLSGVGVYVSYFVEAGLATMYLIAYTIWQIQKWRKIKKPPQNKPILVSETEKRPAPKKGITLTQRINDSFRGSLGSFLTASMLMSVVLLGAAIYITGGKANTVKARRDRDDQSQQLPYLSSAIYDMVLSLLASVFSVFPVLMLYSLMGRHQGPTSKKGSDSRTLPDVHRVWLRRVVLVVIWALAATQVYLAPRGDLNYNERHDPDAEMYTDFCDHRGGNRYWNGMKAAQFLVIGAPLLWLFITTFLLTGFNIPGIKDKPWVVKWRSIWRLGIAWLNLLIMWGVLGYFAILRRRIIKTAGGLDNETTWSFGQILALATWAPVIFEFVYIFVWGIEESLGTHLPVGFRISRNDKPDPIDFSMATMGVDPFGDEVPLMGLKPTFTSETSPLQHAIPVLPGFTPFSPMSPGNQSDFPEAVQQQSSSAYEPYYDSGQPQTLHARTPWEQWNASGW